MRALTIFALLAVFSGTASALLPGPYAPSSVGNAITFGAGTASAASTAGHAFTFASNGTVLLNGPVTFSPSTGVNVTANMVGEISKPNAAAAIGRFAAKVVAPLAFGVALWDLAKELGFTASNKPNGAPGADFTKSFSTIDILKDYSTDGGNSWHGSSGAACASFITRTQASYAGFEPPRTLVQTQSAPTCKGNIILPGYGVLGIEQYTYEVREKQITGGREEPATLQEFLDAIAAKSGWPGSSALALATKQAIQSGETAPVVPKTVTGPATGPSTVTTTDDGQKITTKTKTPKYTYAGPKVTTTTTTTTTVVDKATGQPIGSPIVETETPVLPQKEPEKEPTITCGLPDTPACKIDETGTPEPTTEDAYKTKLDKTKADQDALRDKTGGTADKPILDGWGALFITPPLAACVPYTLPRDMGAIDPCPVVDGVRAVMAFLWAITALWSGMRMVREVI